MIGGATLTAVVAAQESSVERVRRNVRALMEFFGFNQAELAERIGKSQSWVSKRVKGNVPFKLKDLDALASALGVPAPSLLYEYGSGAFERRRGQDRRSGLDRRRSARAEPQHQMPSPSRQAPH